MNPTERKKKLNEIILTLGKIFPELKADETTIVENELLEGDYMVMVSFVCPLDKANWTVTYEEESDKFTIGEYSAPTMDGLILKYVNLECEKLNRQLQKLFDINTNLLFPKTGG